LRPTAAAQARRRAGARQCDRVRRPRHRFKVVTSLGNFTIELNAERAPLTVAHFLKYVDQGHLPAPYFTA
jgi:hypothetical protein